MNETKQIERATAEGFLNLYNAKIGSDFQIYEHSDAPDVRCKDGDIILNLEITLTEDHPFDKIENRPSDIQAMLGRSNHRSVEALKEHLHQIKQGIAKPRVNCLSDNVMDQLISRIEKKFTKSYGSKTALVIRDTSGVDWDWDRVEDEIDLRLQGLYNPFDRGIWILNLAKTKLYKIVDEFKSESF